MANIRIRFGNKKFNGMRSFLNHISKKYERFIITDDEREAINYFRHHYNSEWINRNTFVDASGREKLFYTQERKRTGGWK